MVCSLCCERDESFAARAAQEDLPQQLFSCSPPPIPVPACCASGLSFQLRVLGPAPRYRSELLPPGVPSACGCCGNPCRLLPPPDLPNGLACPPLLNCMFGFVCQVCPSVFHLRDARIRIVRIHPLPIRPLAHTLSVQLRQLLPRRHSDP